MPPGREYAISHRRGLVGEQEGEGAIMGATQGARPDHFQLSVGDQIPDAEALGHRVLEGSLCDDAAPPRNRHTTTPGFPGACHRGENVSRLCSLRDDRSEERRVGKGVRTWWRTYQ